jgi:hypothetical protein
MYVCVYIGADGDMGGDAEIADMGGDADMGSTISSTLSNSGIYSGLFTRLVGLFTCISRSLYTPL